MFFKRGLLLKLLFILACTTLQLVPHTSQHKETLCYSHMVAQSASISRGSGRQLTGLLLPTLEETEEETSLGVSGSEYLSNI